MVFRSKLSIDDFKSNLSNGGVRPTMFLVSITYPAKLGTFFNTQSVAGQQVLNKLTFLCKAASIPASTLTTVNAGLPAGGQMKLPGSRLFDPWNTTILNDGKMDVRSLLEEWMQMIIGHNNQLSVMELDRYMTTANVVQLNRQGEAIRSYELRGLYPTSLEPIELASDAFDTISEFQCTWNFHYWQASRSLELDDAEDSTIELFGQIFD